MHRQENKLMQIKKKKKKIYKKYFFCRLAWQVSPSCMTGCFQIAHSKQKFINYSGIYLMNDIIGFQLGYWSS